MKSRRKLVNVLRVEPDFKKKQMLRVLALAATYVAVSTVVVAFFYVRLLHPEMLSSRGFYYDVTNGAALWRELPGLPAVLIVWVSAMTGLSGLFATSVGLHFTHKLAGPLYRFKSELERIADGKDVQPIVLRDGDDFVDVADAMNRALAHLSERGTLPNAEFGEIEELERHRETNRIARETLDRFDASAIAPNERESVEQLCDELRALLAKVDPDTETTTS